MRQSTSTSVPTKASISSWAGICLNGAANADRDTRVTLVPFLLMDRVAEPDERDACMIPVMSGCHVMCLIASCSYGTFYRLLQLCVAS